MKTKATFLKSSISASMNVTDCEMHQKLKLSTFQQPLETYLKKEKVSKRTYPTLQHCLRMLHIMHTTIMKGRIGQLGSKP